MALAYFLGRFLELGLENDLSANRPRPRRFTLFPCHTQVEAEFGYLLAENWKLPHLNSGQGISLFPPRILRAKLQLTRLVFSFWAVGSRLSNLTSLLLGSIADLRTQPLHATNFSLLPCTTAQETLKMPPKEKKERSTNFRTWETQSRLLSALVASLDGARLDYKSKPIIFCCLPLRPLRFLLSLLPAPGQDSLDHFICLDPDGLAEAARGTATRGPLMALPHD